MVKKMSILLSSLLLFSACGEDNIVPDNIPENNFDYNLVIIENVSDAGANGNRTITLSISDKSGNTLNLNAVSGFKYLEAGRYEIVADADQRHEAEIQFGSGAVDVIGGSITVTKKNYEYFFRFDMETSIGKCLGIADGKKLYFEEYKYSSIATGANGNFLKDQQIRSEILNTTMNYSIYLPESYDGVREYPILYMLHGYGGNNNDWLQDNTGGLWAGGGTLPAYAKEFADEGGMEMIIVAPDGKNLFYCDGYEHGWNYMSYFFEEFIPFIESEYAVKKGRSSRAIGGLSMGGYGSLYYGFLHPEMFCHVYACSAATSVGGNIPDLAQMLSAAATSGTLESLPELTLEIGTEDTTCNNEAFVKTLDSYNIPFEYITRPGGHDWKFWNACSPKIIRKTATVFNNTK